MDYDREKILDEINKLTLKVLKESREYQNFLNHLGHNPRECDECLERYLRTVTDGSYNGFGM